MINHTQEDVIKKWKESETNKPLVSIQCITYNHENYIGQAIDGFLMQKTNFSFEVIIHDDASTDKTASIIKEYELKFPKIIKPIYETENQYSKHDGSLTRIMNKACQGKYIAFCEGDDYWIDPNKLQMQVDFLEAHPDYGMCYTKVKRYRQKDNTFLHRTFGSEIIDFKDLLTNGNRIPTLVTCLKKELLDAYHIEIKPETKNWLMGDIPMWLYFAKNSKIFFIPKVTGVYRILENSASHSIDYNKSIKFLESYNEIRNFFKDLYLNEKEKSLFYIDVNLQKGMMFLRNGDREFTIKHLSLVKKKGITLWIKIFMCKNNFLFQKLRKYTKNK